MVHSFSYTQKLDKIILEYLREKLQIISKIRSTKLNNHILGTTNYKNIVYIKNFFFNKLKKMKSVEYRVWAKSLNNYRSDYKTLSIVQSWMRKFRNRAKKNT